MVGIIVELALSWLMLWLLQQQHLGVLGFRPTAKRLREFSIGFLLAAACCSLYFLLKVGFDTSQFRFNSHANLNTIGGAGWWTFRSVIFEELIFRGALLYILIQRLGERWACTISAVAFGVYHLFSYNAFGNPLQMALIFGMTAIFGLMLSAAFAKTRSMYLPVALHFGWNLFNIVVFSNGPLGEQLLLRPNKPDPQGWYSLAVFIFQVTALPLLAHVYLRSIGKSKRIQPG